MRSSKCRSLLQRSGCTLRERKPRPAAAVNLPAARRVVCAGRGLARQEDLGLVNELAKVLGAEVACTRPLAEGLDWLPRERYIGISGATIKPDLYLGVGVSGQAQHVIGMSDSRVVVAINKDQQRADLFPGRLRASQTICIPSSRR